MDFPFLKRVGTQISDFFRNPMEPKPKPEAPGIFKTIRGIVGIKDKNEDVPPSAIKNGLISPRSDAHVEMPDRRAAYNPRMQEPEGVTSGPGQRPTVTPAEQIRQAIFNRTSPTPTATRVPVQPTAQPTSIASLIQPTRQPSVMPTAMPTSGPPYYGRDPRTQTMYIDPAVRQAIELAAQKFGLPKELLYDIAAQESSFDPMKRNDTPAGIEAGIPEGLFQFTPNTWQQVLNYSNNPNSAIHKVLPSKNRNDPKANALAAAYLIKMGQLGKWDASEDVWGNYWTPKELEDMGLYRQSLYHKPGTRASARLNSGKKSKNKKS